MEEMSMKTSGYRLLVSFALATSSGWLSAATPLNETHTVGAVQQWAPSARTIRVDGVTFQTGSDFQVLDRRGRKLSLQSVRPGIKVMVISIEGTALQVIVDPGSEHPFDQPQR